MTPSAPNTARIDRFRHTATPPHRRYRLNVQMDPPPAVPGSTANTPNTGSLIETLRRQTGHITHRHPPSVLAPRPSTARNRQLTRPASSPVRRSPPARGSLPSQTGRLTASLTPLSRHAGSPPRTAPNTPVAGRITAPQQHSTPWHRHGQTPRPPGTAGSHGPPARPPTDTPHRPTVHTPAPPIPAVSQQGGTVPETPPAQTGQRGSLPGDIGTLTAPQSMELSQPPREAPYPLGIGTLTERDRPSPGSERVGVGACDPRYGGSHSGAEISVAVSGPERRGLIVFRGSDPHPVYKDCLNVQTDAQPRCLVIPAGSSPRQCHGQAPYHPSTDRKPKLGGADPKISSPETANTISPSLGGCWGGCLAERLDETHRDVQTEVVR